LGVLFLGTPGLIIGIIAGVVIAVGAIAKLVSAARGMVRG